MSRTPLSKRKGNKTPAQAPWNKFIKLFIFMGLSVLGIFVYLFVGDINNNDFEYYSKIVSPDNNNHNSPLLRATTTISSNNDNSNHNNDDKKSTMSTSQVPKQLTPPFLELPKKTTSVILNLGSSVDPLIPKPSDGPCAMAIALEPIRPFEIIPHPQLQVLPAAVVPIDKQGQVASMTVYNGGLSSSLSKASYEGRWNRVNKKSPSNQNKNANGQVRLVPTVSLETMLQQIPPHIRIPYIMTDIQGFDFQVISSTDPKLLLDRVERIESEVYLKGLSPYENVMNDFCLDWLPYMKEAGFEFDGVMSHQTRSIINGYENYENAERTCANEGKERKAGIMEAEAMWRAPSVGKGSILNDYTYPKHADKHGKEIEHHKFSVEEYNGCYEDNV